MDNFKNLTVADLKSRLKALHLSTSGYRAQLEQRLLAGQGTSHKADYEDQGMSKNDYSNPTNSESLVLYIPDLLPAENGFNDQVLGELAIATAQYHTVSSQENPNENEKVSVLCNKEGHTLLDELAELKEELKDMREGNDDRFIKLEGQFSSMNIQLEALQRLEGSVTAMRMRFFSTIKRDDLKDTMKQSDWDTIKQGNGMAHSGSCIIDAGLYEKSFRKDATLFRYIYGISWQEVISIRHKDLIELVKPIDLRGTLIGEGIPAKERENFEKLYKDYISMVEDAEIEDLPEFKMDDSSALRLRYLSCLKTGREILAAWRDKQKAAKN